MSASEPPVTAPADQDGWPSPAGPAVDGADLPAPGTRRAPRPHAATTSDLTRRGRVRKWDRPPPPHDWRWWVGNVGKVLVTAGLLLFGFVAYQLWGTAIETARAQSSLESEFERLLADAPPITVGATGSDTADPGSPDPDSSSESDDPDPSATDDPSVTDGGAPTGSAPAVVVPVEDQNLRRVENGDALARIEIPRIGVDDIVVAGVDTGDLKRGPGHFPNTPLPGQLGNSAIAGHRTTYGQPFFDVDRLQVGDEIRVTTLNGRYTYRVTGQRIVEASDYEVVATTDPTRANLTLTSCHPKWTAKLRIVISSELSATESSPVGAPVLNYGRPGPAVADGGVDPATDDDATPGTAASDAARDDGVDATISDPLDDSTGDADGDGASPGSLDGVDGSDLGRLGAESTNEEIADAFSEGWFSDPSANGQVGLWGLAVSVIAFGAYLLSRRTRRDWIGGLVGLVPFVVALYFLFQNVNRLLPPNL